MGLYSLNPEAMTTESHSGVTHAQAQSQAGPATPAEKEGEGRDTKDPHGQGSPQGHQAQKPRPKALGVIEGSSLPMSSGGVGAGTAKRQGHPNRELGL